MPYTNEVEPLYVQGGSSPPLIAQLWMVIRTVGGPTSTRNQSVRETASVPGIGRRPFTLVTGPALPPPAMCGLTLHDTAPGMNGPLFRFGDIDVLPPPFSADAPEGYVSYVALGPIDIDALTYPPPKKFLISGTLPPGMMLSVRRIQASGTTISAWTSVAGWGDITLQLFPLSIREPAPSGSCPLRTVAATTNTMLDLALLHRIRDTYLPAPVVDGYYRNAAETADLLVRHPALARRAATLLTRAQDALTAGQPGRLPVREGVAFLTALAGFGSPCLRADILALIPRVPELTRRLAAG